MLASSGNRKPKREPRDWCDLCRELYPLPMLARVTWITVDGRESEGGVCCSGCWSQLNTYFDERSSIWTPLFRSM